MIPPLLAASVASPDDLAVYVPVAITLALGGLIAMGLVVLVTRIGLREKSHIKAMPFESGSVPIGDARKRVHVQYYVVALLFIVFDLETVFLLIWAPVFRDLGLYGLTVMGPFIALLVIGLFYEWKKGALDWGSDD